jgi:hypothetical protein
MMTGRTGYTNPTNDNTFAPPADMTAVYEHFDPLIGETVATAADLPSSGNWVGRTITVVDTGFVYIWFSAGWKFMAGSAAADIATFSTGWTSMTGGHKARIRRQGNLVTLHGGILFGTNANYNSMFTVPSGFAPATTSVQFIGMAMASIGSGTGVALELVITNGLVSFAGSGYSTGSNPPLAFVTLGGCQYWLD